MKSLTNLLLGFILSTQFVFAGGHDGLKQAIDEYHYAMTVEWDQVDPSFAQDQELKFQMTIEKLMNDGLSAADLEKMFTQETSLNSKQLIEEINSLNLQDSFEVKWFIQQKLESHYSRGANWTREDTWQVVAIVGVFAFFGTLIYTLATCGKNGRPQC